MALNSIKPLKGRLLLAEPMLQSVYFKRSVILLADYNEKGSVGFVLNKRIEANLSDVIPEMENTNFPLFIGGPVSRDNLYFIHSKGNKIEGSVKLGSNLYWGGDFDTIKKMIHNNQIKEDEIKFFIGYSGWDADQLEKEIEENTWIISNLNNNSVLNYNVQNLWSDALKKMGNKFAILANFPEDPNLN